MKNKRFYAVVLICLVSTVYTTAQEGRDMLILFWNMENFFDYTDQGTGSSDKEFTPEGARKWTPGRFYSKCSQVAKSIMWIGDNYGRLPDVIGLCEVENSHVLKSMIYSTALSKYGYRYVHYESDDHRGIDVALLYRHPLRPLDSYPIKIDSLRTRDILKVDFGHTVFFVNHHPSKFSGAESSSGPRKKVMRMLKSACDSVLLTDSTKRVVAMGDFNDTPDGEAFKIIAPSMRNLAEKLAEKGEGTIRFEGKWDLIDMFLVAGKDTGDLQMETVRIPWLISKDNKHSGWKPLRTYSGPRYLGGVSDHLPVLLRLE